LSRINAAEPVILVEALMQFALLIHESPEAWETRPRDQSDPYVAAWRSYYKALVGAGVYAGGNPLDVPETATTLRMVDGRMQIQDGPFADTKEQLAGMVVIEAASLDEAIEWGARCPATSRGAVEIRPLAPAVHRKITE
jgi:hypothetical protein